MKRVGFGCMRLSTLRDRDESRAAEVLHAALDAGATLLDTADVYCLDAEDVGHNERLIAGALASWSGDASTITVATKGGLIRPSGRWVPNGKAKHLEAACAASREALGFGCIDLYQLHAVNPRVKLATSVRALARLQAAGAVRRVGLCNVTVGQIEEARAILEVASVQVELSALVHASVQGGVIDYCREHDIEVIAHSPLGGPKKVRRLARDRSVVDVATRRGVEPADVALAWLCDAAPGVVVIPGATTVEHARSVVAAQTMELGEDDRAELDARFEIARQLRIPRSKRRPPDDAAGEVVIVMGCPGAGKSTAAIELVEKGYERLNRDSRGGRLAGLVAAMRQSMEAGGRRYVLDNSYATRAARNAVVEAAWRHGIPVRCIFVNTPLEQAQINTVRRMIQRHGRLLGPDEMKAAGKSDPNAFPPRVQFDYRRKLEPPVPSEGFREIHTRPFARVPSRANTRRALILEYDDVLRRADPQGPADVALLPGVVERIRHYHDEGFRLLGVSWQPGVGEERVTRQHVQSIFDRTHDLLGVAIDVRYCPHPGGPPICWCRKPLPGLGVALIDEYQLDPSQCIFVGRNPTDRSFASRLGFQYRDVSDNW